MGDHFWPYYFDQSRYLVFYGGAGSGKSHAAASDILLRVLTENVGHRVFIVRKTFPSLRKSCFALFQDKIRIWGLQEFFEINKSELTITCKLNGNQIITASMDDPEKIKSIERVTSVWIEEPTEITEDNFIQIDLRLRGDVGTKKQIILTFNPIDQRHWLKRFFFDRVVKDCKIDHSTAWMNPWLDDSYRDLLLDLKNQNPTLYDVYALGKWGTLKDLILSNWVVVKDFPDSPDSVVWGIDFGYNNPTAVLKIGEKDSDIYWEQQLYKTKLTNADLIEHLKQIGVPQDEPIYCDSAEPDRIAELVGAGFNAKPSDKSVKNGLDFLKRKKIHVVDGSDDLIKELQGYSYKTDKNGEPVDEPVKYKDHLIDCGRYGTYTHFKQVVEDWAFVSGQTRI